MVSSLVVPGVRVHVVHFLQRHMEMAPNDVGRRKRFPGSSTEQEPKLAAANELLEPTGKHESC